MMEGLKNECRERFSDHGGQSVTGSPNPALHQTAIPLRSIAVW